MNRTQAKALEIKIAHLTAELATCVTLAERACVIETIQNAREQLNDLEASLKFNAAIKAAVRLVRQVAINTAENYKPLEQKALRAIDRCYDLVRFQVDTTTHDQCTGIHAAWRFATRAGAALRKEARYAEMNRLQVSIREAAYQRRIAVGY